MRKITIGGFIKFGIRKNDKLIAMFNDADDREFCYYQLNSIHPHNYYEEVDFPFDKEKTEKEEQIKYQLDWGVIRDAIKSYFIEQDFPLRDWAYEELAGLIITRIENHSDNKESELCVE